MPSRFKRPRSISPPETHRKRHNWVPSNSKEGHSSPLTSERVTIFSWNVNGIEPLIQKRITFESSGSYPLRSVLRRHNWPQLFCMQEVKINRNDVATQRRFEQAANHGNLPNDPTYTAHFSLPRDKYNATGFGGKVHGVATLIRDDFVSKVTTTKIPDWDLEGRVLIHETTYGIVVVNGYWVNGTSNPYRDPCTGRVTGTRHDHKLRFHQEMLDYVLAMEKMGYDVVLIGDMNVARAATDGHPNLRTSPVQHVRNRTDFNDKFFLSKEGMQGIDIFRYLHDNDKQYTYYPRNQP